MKSQKDGTARIDWGDYQTDPRVMARRCTRLVRIHVVFPFCGASKLCLGWMVSLRISLALCVEGFSWRHCDFQHLGCLLAFSAFVSLSNDRDFILVTPPLSWASLGPFIPLKSLPQSLEEAPNNPIPLQSPS